MASVFLFVVLGFILLAVVAEVIYLLTLIFKEKEKYRDNPIFVNFLSNRTNGRALGVEIETTKVANRQILEFLPKDIDLVKLKDKKIESEKAILDNYMLVTLPKGLLSKDKTIKFGLPMNPEELPLDLKNHPFGQMLMNFIKLQSLSKTEAEVLRECINRQKNILIESGGGELSENHIKMVSAAMEDFVKLLSKGKDREVVRGPLGPGSSQ